MNPGTFYSPASLLNPRSRQGKKKSATGHPKIPPANIISPSPSPHSLLNPKGSLLNKDKNDEPTTSGDLNSNPAPKYTAAGQRSNLQHSGKMSAPSTRALQPRFTFTNNDDNGHDDEMEIDHSNSIGQASMLAKSHNLQDRSEEYAKRQKLSTSNGSSWIGNNGGSEVSRHLKDKRAEGLAEASSLDASDNKSRTVVDLTDDAEDDVLDDGAEHSLSEDTGEYQQTSTGDSQTDQDQEVCIGQVDGAMIAMDRIPAVPRSSHSLNSNMWPAHKIKLLKVDAKGMRIIAFDCENKDFGTLGHKWAYGISLALNANKITKLSAVLLGRKKRPNEVPGTLVSDLVPAKILVFCKQSVALNLYKQLAKQKAPLRRPIVSEEWLAKIHYYDVEAELYDEGGADIISGAKIDQAAIERLEHDVFDVINDIPEHNDLAMMEANPEFITTPLLPYQKQGLQFLTEQESNKLTLLEENDTGINQSGAGLRSLWRLRYDNKESVKFVNRATGIVQTEAPIHTMGGLLADEMGLGKTLTIIALIASTIYAAEEWCQSDRGEVIDGIRLCNIRTTLVIVPTTVLQNWEEQLTQHTVENSLSVLRYHGANRPTKLMDLTDYDVILTTYGTIQSEMGWHSQREKRRKSLFAHFNFYRVVLDEAHHIKSHATERARCIFDLHAERRWAITGTPIQNGLEDFGSILKFLRLAPFDKLFKQLVTLPAKREPEIVLGRMRLVFNSITLRRTKDKLRLPQNNKMVEHISLRDDEKALYDRFTKEVNRRINDMARDELSRNYMTYFSQLLSCRRLCDSTDLLSDKEKGMLSKDVESGDEDTESGAKPTANSEITEESGYKQLNTLNEFMAAECSRCNQQLLKETLDGDAENHEICRFWDCLCLICPECSEQFTRDVQDREEDCKFKCPETDVIANTISIKLTYNGFIKYRETLLQQEREDHNKVARRYTQASSKTEALLKHLEEARRDGSTDGLPNKSVVFTFWSNYLDLLQIDLGKAGFNFLRMDGSVSQTKRIKILQQFNNDPEVTILISTIGAGGVGINLQVANSVFIMEPQWNPAAEEQAIDRVHRLGQTRAVKTVRFIVNDTVEVGIRALAQQKQALADLTTSKTKLKRSDVTAKLQDLLNVLQRR